MQHERGVSDARFARAGFSSVNVTRHSVCSTRRAGLVASLREGPTRYGRAFFNGGSAMDPESPSYDRPRPRGFAALTPEQRRALGQQRRQDRALARHRQQVRLEQRESGRYASPTNAGPPIAGRAKKHATPRAKAQRAGSRLRTTPPDCRHHTRASIQVAISAAMSSPCASLRTSW